MRPVGGDEGVGRDRLAAVAGDQDLALGDDGGGEIEQAAAGRRAGARRCTGGWCRSGARRRRTGRRSRRGPTLTKWIETRPWPAARSAQSPMRPTWPELRSVTTARPAERALAMPRSAAIRADGLAEAEVAVDHGVGGALGDDGGLLPGADAPVAQPLHVAGDADDAVAVVPGQVGGGEVGGDAPGLPFVAAGGLEDGGDVGPQRAERDGDGGQRHQPPIPAMPWAMAR